jgi:D-inositol-3-phosphate glycosyltransferase
LKPRILMIDALVGNDYSLILCNALKKEGARISLVVTEDRKFSGNETFKILPWLPSKTKGKSKLAKTIKYFKYLGKLFFYIRKNADVVHFQFFRRKRVESIFYRLLKTAGYKLVHTVHDVIPLDENKTDIFFNNIVYKSSDILIVHSEPNRKSLEQFSIDSRKIRVVPHGNFDMFLSGDIVSQQCARDKYDLKPEADVLLFFGFIKKYKGLDLLLDAFSKASNINSKLHLIIAGAAESDELGRHYTDKIKKIHSADRILFHNSFIDDKEVQYYFQASDIVVLPYRQISHSGVMHLAYSFGKPLIVTDTGDFIFTVSDDNSGFPVHKYEAEDLSQVILTAFSDKEKLNNMSLHISKLNKTKYSWENTARLTMNIYNNLAGDSKR